MAVREEILSLIKHNPLEGYNISKRIKRTSTDTLTRMWELGLVRRSPSLRHPTATLYAITSGGKKFLSKSKGNNNKC